jgi:hypothetical protein
MTEPKKFYVTTPIYYVIPDCWRIRDDKVII